MQICFWELRGPQLASSLNVAIVCAMHANYSSFISYFLVRIYGDVDVGSAQNLK